MAFYGFPEEFECRFAIPALRNIAFKHFALAINCPLKVMGLAVDLHENLVRMPLPV
jgi:hypothetical protein